MIFTPNNPAKVAAYIDHTVLKATATRAEIETLCEEARRLQVYSVCINACWIPLAVQALAGCSVLPITVVGFPLGATLARAKAAETQIALEVGAREIDMVMNIGLAKDGQWKGVESDINEVRRACGDTPLKVILETCYLTEPEIVTACKAAVAAGAAFVKTSTGFGPSGATVETVALMRKTVGPQIGVKASGGVRTWSDFGKMIDAGANRIGSSNSVKIIEEYLSSAGAT